MKRKQPIHTKKILLHFFIPYIVIMLVTHLIGFYSSYRLLQSMKAEVETVHLASLKQTEEQLKHRFAEIDLIAKQILNHPKVVHYQNIEQPFIGNSTYTTIDLINELHDYKQSNTFIYDYYIYYEKSDLVVTATTSYRLPTFFQLKYGYEEIGSDEWKEFLMSRYHLKTIVPQKLVNMHTGQRQMVSYIYSIGMPYSYRGAVVFLIDTQDINQMLRNEMNMDSGWAYITNENGEIISSVGTEQIDDQTIEIPDNHQGVVNQKIDGKEMTVTYLHSDETNWNYVIVQPTNIVMDKVINTQKNSLTTLYISLFISILIALFLAKRSSGPLSGMVRKIEASLGGKSVESKNAYTYLEGAFTELSKENANLVSRLSEQVPILRLTYIDQLVKGEFTSIGEMKQSLQHVGIDLDGDYYNVLLIRMPTITANDDGDEFTHLDTLRLFVKDFIEDEFPTKHFVYDLTGNEITLLLVDVAKDVESYKQLLSKKISHLLQTIEDQLDIKMYIGIGGVYSELSLVPKSFDEAFQSLRTTNFIEQPHYIWFDELPKRKSMYYYSADIENRLMNVVRAGDEGEVEKLLKTLYHENFIHKHLSYAAQQLFLYELVGSLMKVLEVMDKKVDDEKEKVEEILESLTNNGQLLTNYQMIEETFIQLARDLHNRKKSKNSHLRDELIEYIQLHYHDSNISLHEIAQHFHMSEVYVSQFFKEQTGENFSECLERIRMKEACVLLVETNLSVNDIAQKVGYQSVNTFGRAFKRVHAMTATAYRSMHKHQ